MQAHTYSVRLRWTGNLGSGTSGYRTYSRDHTLEIAGKADILGSSDPLFRGDPARHNPEELLVASLSSCHMLWFLHLCADAGVAVTEYSDEASGTMVLEADGGGRFTEVTLRPLVEVAELGMTAQLEALHHRAHALCFIANSMNFPVRHEPRHKVKAV